MPKLSVIVPIYNAEKYIERCLKSILSQTFKDLEIILVNDGSTDNSQEIIEKYSSKYPDLIKFFAKENGGQATARNLGIEKASGEYIAFVDIDDYLELDAYEKAIEYIEKNNLDIVCFDFWEVINGQKVDKEHYGINANDNARKYIVSESSPVNKVMKAEIFKKNGVRFLENYIYEDLATMPILAKYTSNIGFLSERLYDYDIHENSTMRQKEYNSKLENIFVAVERLYKEFIDTEYVEELEYIYIEHLLHAANLRFLAYKEGQNNIDKISKIMKEKFPNWRKNRYYKMQSLKYKIICNLFYYKQKNLLRIILGGNNA
ncbi:MAG: glycosyltransferase [Clostridia bacterium]|nr:glycosyltransferase [Clostridia bacterium]